MIDRLRWYFIHTLAAGRGPTWIVIALTVAAGAFLADAWYAQRQARATDAERATRLHLAATSGMPAAGPSDVDLFLRKLPDADGWGTQVRQLFALANDTGVSLEHGEYASTAQSASLLHSLQITLPVKGEPARIAAFAAAIYAQMPAVAIESMALKRDSADKPVVEARLVLVAYTKATNTGEAP